MAEPNAELIKEQVRAVINAITELILSMTLGTGQQENETTSTNKNSSKTTDQKE